MNSIEQIKELVKYRLHEAESGHDWNHTERVLHNAIMIAENEDIDQTVVILGALLHDIADSKFHEGNEEIGPEIASQIMDQFDIDSSTKEHVISIIRNISFKNSFDKQNWRSRELEIVRDADRLEAIGAIGIARAFTYGGYKNLPLFDKKTAPMNNLTKEKYQSTKAPTINHFYEKLLLLKDKMHTAKGRELAEQRHQFLLHFLDQFYLELGYVPEWHKPGK